MANDTFDGGDGTDTLVFNGSNVNEVMEFATSMSGFQFTRDVGTIVIDNTNVERVDVDGLGGDDTIDGSGQTNTGVALEITGGAGNDSLTGGAGNDSFVFGALRSANDCDRDPRYVRLRLRRNRGEM